MVFCTLSMPLFDVLAQVIAIKPEKTQLQVGTAGSGTTSLPLFVALEGGYFAKRGLNVTVSQVGATVAVQGVISGTIDIYQGGTAAIAANLAGADLIYVAAAVDRNSLILFGPKAHTSLEGLRGKSIATTFPAPWRIAMRMTARKTWPRGRQRFQAGSIIAARRKRSRLSSWETPTDWSSRRRKPNWQNNRAIRLSSTIQRRVEDYWARTSVMRGTRRSIPVRSRRT